MDHSPARRLRRIVTVTVAAVGLAASTVPAAQAAQAQDREGTTRVAVAPAVVAKLERLNLAAAPTGNSTAAPFNGTVAFRFPITDVKRDGNIIKHAGGARISSGHEAIALKRFKIKMGAGKVGAAVVVNGERVGRAEVFNLAESGRPGLGDVRLTLTRAAAGAVNSTFGAPAFDAGDNFGFATVNLD